MKKTNRRSKQPIDASPADAEQDCSNRVSKLEQENKAFQVSDPFLFRTSKFSDFCLFVCMYAWLIDLLFVFGSFCVSGVCLVTEKI